MLLVFTVGFSLQQYLSSLSLDIVIVVIIFIAIIIVLKNSINYHLLTDNL